MPVLILAGGLATRMRPATEKIPKSLIEIAGKPFLWHQLTLLKRSGISRVVLAVGHLGELIEKEFGDGSALDIALSYSFDGRRLLGTAGAIRNALALLPERFFVLYGDSYLTCDYKAVEWSFLKSGLPALMTVYRNQDQLDKSNIEFGGGRILKYDKRNPTASMHHIDYGLGAFARGVFESLPEGSVRDLADVYSALAASGDLAAFEVHERFYEIGSPEGLRETDDFLRAAKKSVC